MNYVPSESMQAFAQAAPVVVRGRLTSVREGRTIGAKPGEFHGSHTAVLEVSVSAVVRGTGEERLYVEVPRSLPTTIAELQSMLPNDEMVFFLKKAEEPKNTLVFNSGSGLPEDAMLLQTTSPEGIVIERSGRLLQPLLEQDDFQLVRSFPTLTSLLDGLGKTREPTTVAP